ncbi:MAG: CDP-glycerol glycerophosphotransferase family protein [Candidatus Shapirobacteria bacterium]|nr:CDP-glycerol glycerophosphotransferase family protein [Candidatus Shapirobacteria bacterium]
MIELFIFLNKLLVKIIPSIFIWYPVNYKKVSFVNKHYSDSNLLLTAKMLLKQNPEIKIQYITNNPRKSTIAKQIIFYFKLLNSRVIVTTHGPVIKTKKNISLELWHGMPIKGMNLMDNLKEKHTSFSNIDHLNSYSQFFNTVMNACFGVEGKKYIILGSPQNDLLFDSKNKEKIFRLFRIKKNQKYVIYMPTFRDNIKNYQNYQNFVKNLGFYKFDLQIFNKFLIKNNLKLILKPHPNDNNLWKEFFEELKLSNILLLTEEYLIKNNLELYEILGLSDLLITDYSSVYVDYLLIDKPVIFVPTDIDQYRKIRTLLLEPYDFWAPGPKVYDQKKLEEEIVKSLKDVKYYQEERNILKNIFHKYQDNKSTERVVNHINLLLRSK